MNLCLLNTTHNLNRITAGGICVLSCARASYCLWYLHDDEKKEEQQRDFYDAMNAHFTGNFNNFNIFTSEKINKSRIISFFRSFFCEDAANKLWNATDLDILKQDLLHDYDPILRPSNSKASNSIHVGMTLINIDLDENRGVLTSHAWLKMNWSDSKLQWKPEDYNGIDHLRIGADEVKFRADLRELIFIMNSLLFLGLDARFDYLQQRRA